MFIATLDHAIGLTEQLMSRIGVAMMIFSLLLLVPQFNSIFATATTLFSIKIVFNVF